MSAPAATAARRWPTAKRCGVAFKIHVHLHFVRLILVRRRDNGIVTPEELEDCWKDPQNRRWGVYCCKSDPRVIVPKRLKWVGWTINFARPSAIPVVLLTLAILLVPVTIAKALYGGNAVVLLTLLTSIAVVCLLCAYLSSSKRWID